jgi:hypothetical protein
MTRTFKVRAPILRRQTYRATSPGLTNICAFVLHRCAVECRGGRYSGLPKRNCKSFQIVKPVGMLWHAV